MFFVLLDRSRPLGTHHLRKESPSSIQAHRDSRIFTYVAILLALPIHIKKETPILEHWPNLLALTCSLGFAGHPFNPQHLEARSELVFNFRKDSRASGLSSGTYSKPCEGRQVEVLGAGQDWSTMTLNDSISFE